MVRCAAVDEPLGGVGRCSWRWVRGSSRGGGDWPGWRDFGENIYFTMEMLGRIRRMYLRDKVSLPEIAHRKVCP